MRFEWDRRKAQVNWLKHRTLFEEASTVFADPLSATIADPDHSFGEYRWVYRRYIDCLWSAIPTTTMDAFESSAPARRTAMKKRATKTKSHKSEMRAEYDFSDGVRGKYHRAVRADSNIVVLEPDVAARFKNARAVNVALRAVIKAADQTRD